MNCKTNRKRDKNPIFFYTLRKFVNIFKRLVINAFKNDLFQFKYT